MVEQEGRSEESTNPSFALLTSEFLNFLKTTDSLDFISLDHNGYIYLKSLLWRLNGLRAVWTDLKA